MKTIFLLSLFLVAACDVPSGQRRQIFQTPTGDALKDGNPPTNSNGAVNPGPTPTTTPGTPSATDSATSGAGFQACNLTAVSSTTALGSMGVCQSTVDETQVKFQTTVADSFARTCLIPTYKDSTGSSTYVGQPQCTYTEAGKIYLGRLYKNRVGFEMFPINGVIIMKEALLTSYFDCMHSFTFYQQNYNCTSASDYRVCMQQLSMYNPNAHQTCCQRQAANYRTLVCNTFKANFTGQYLDLRLK